MKYSFIYFSPHLDDVVLSCGGLLKKNYKKRQLIINIFSGDYSGLTKWDLSCGIKRENNPVLIRKRENQDALKSLKVRSVYLRFLDNAVFIDLKKKKRSALDFKKIKKEIFQILSKSKVLPEAIFFPLGISHPDHYLISKIGKIVAKKLEIRKIKIYFYEDFPFFNKNLKNKSLLKNYHPVYFKINKKIFYKIRMVTSYKTQLFSLLKILNPKIKTKRNINNIWKKILLNYHQKIAKQSKIKTAKYCERYWLFKNSNPKY